MLAKSILDRLSTEPPWVFVTNSFGAIVAMEIARIHPEVVHALIISGCPGLKDYSPIPKNTRKLTLTDCAKIADSLFYDKAHISDSLIDATFKSLQQPGRMREFVRCLKIAKTYGVALAVEQLACPVLLAWGEHDLLTPFEPWKAVVGTRPNTTVQLISNSGHSPMIEQPVAFASAVSEFLNSFQ